MTINPVDLQVTLPQTGQVNRIQRGLQQQQQIEQQVTVQLVYQEMREKEQTIQKMKATDYNKVHNEDLEKKKEKRRNNKETDKNAEPAAVDEEKSEKPSVSKNVEYKGSLLDIKV